MSDYVKARDALESLHHSYVSTAEERDGLRNVIRRIGAEATGADATLACQNITRIVNAVRKEGEW